MLNPNDFNQIEAKGMTIEQFNTQLQAFKDGFPYLKLYAEATTKHGIVTPNEADHIHSTKAWERYLQTGHTIVKFVPASGAASRMFKDLFSYLNGSKDILDNDFIIKFFDNIENFAFYSDLNSICVINEGKNINELLNNKDYKRIINNLLNTPGLGYGQLPKGLLKFHKYKDEVRTPLEEHLVEGALYAKDSNNIVNVHFTVSKEHRELFATLVNNIIDKYSEMFGVIYNINFSEQKPSTDTVAVNPDNTPFRNEDGSILFRPGGHGALIENLNDIDADIVFIKNIDNVVPDKYKDDTVIYKKILAGVLVRIQQKIFNYLELIDGGNISKSQIDEILSFMKDELFIINPQMENIEDKNLVEYLKSKLDRPIRVCGMVKNVGEPGGGPFWAYNNDGSISLQILESSQIDNSNKEYLKMFTEGTHFNPVDIVCGLKNYKGNRFDLRKYVDHATGFISNKSKDGKELKALELPGLWNGSMSDWTTIFVEVPLSTFNPVKTVNDLLRKEHQ